MRSLRVFSLQFLLLELKSIAAAAAAAVVPDEGQCGGHAPMEQVAIFLGHDVTTSTWWNQNADKICCDNTKGRWAEEPFFFDSEGVYLFPLLLEPSNGAVMTFYDSVCGIPLFVFPSSRGGRTFQEFWAETEQYGWPSFRPDEVVSENVVLNHDDGRITSVCGTHLGHNLPVLTSSADGGSVMKDRYSINLVCIAGTPVILDDDSSSDGIGNDIASIIPEYAITADAFNASTYVSKAPQWSGKKYPAKQKNNPTIDTLICMLIVVVMFAVKWIAFDRWWKKKRHARGVARHYVEEEASSHHDFEDDDLTAASSESDEDCEEVKVS